MRKRLIKRVIVTGVGAGAGITLATAFKRHGWLVVGVDSAFSPTHVHQFYIVSDARHPGLVDELLLVVRRERTTLLLPTRSDEFLPLAARQREFHRLGTSLYLPLPDVVATLLDPHSLSRELKYAGLKRPSGDSPPHESGSPEDRLFETSVCVDDREPHAIVGCAVFELRPLGTGSTYKAERRKDERVVEEVAQRAAITLHARGPVTMQIRVPADGVPFVTEVSPAPCWRGPLADDLFESFLALWERDQPT